ncbi:unnamed protein product [Prorocentrum cordatum]|uniref:Uncharacterized protein n=1 Tax=Prorocentrum cordatum TaxID=2364126 RepID=A0ABN9V1D8_9DINO|nr:unnamed protein product [Polarella glacialis]
MPSRPDGALGCEPPPPQRRPRGSVEAPRAAQPRVPALQEAAEAAAVPAARRELQGRGALRGLRHVAHEGDAAVAVHLGDVRHALDRVDAGQQRAPGAAGDAEEVREADGAEAVRGVLHLEGGAVVPAGLRGADVRQEASTAARPTNGCS